MEIISYVLNSILALIILPDTVLIVYIIENNMSIAGRYCIVLLFL